VASRLGVNIDHVATLRQARGESYPSVVQAATRSLENGADQITIHLREDRRHIQDTDVEAVRLVTKKFGKPLNFEMGAADEIIEIAIATNPDWICLVPEKREERTTEGGLDLKNRSILNSTQRTVAQLKKSLPQVKVSLFLEADAEVLKLASAMPIEAVEIHTGEFARLFLHGEETDRELARFSSAVDYLKQQRINPHAGHGLTRESVLPLLEARLFEEYNIGHWIICQALFDGLGSVVKDLRDLFDRYPYP
jgi:pyridoxine 5-phosphate synthase